MEIDPDTPTTPLLEYHDPVAHYGMNVPRCKAVRVVVGGFPPLPLGYFHIDVFGRG